MKNNREYRYIENIQTREGRKLEGKAISFNTTSNFLYENGMMFYETIHREAITQSTLDNSNILFLYNHNNDQVLGRCNRGRGSLKLDLREDGVYFSLDLPNTTLGNDIYELVQRGDICQCSFCFAISKGGDEWTVREDGEWMRDIYHIDNLYDISCVNTPAYDDTSIFARSLEIFNEAKKQKRDMKEDEEVKDEVKDEEVREEEVKEEVEETPAEEEVKEEETREEEEDPEEEEETPAEETEETEEEKDEETREDEKDPEEEKEEESRSLKNKDIYIRNDKNENKNITMNKKFSLTKAILDVAEGRGLDNEARAIQEDIKKSMRNANVSMNGQIQLPISPEYLNRDAKQALNVNTLVINGDNVNGQHDNIVATEIQSVLTPLREKNILLQLGARWLGGLTSDIQIPVMTATNVGFNTEVGKAINGSNKFSSVRLYPHRLTAYVPISKQLLIQSTPDVEALIYNDLVEAINSAIEKEAFSSNARDDENNPGGIFDVITAGDDITDFKGVVNLEAALEDANVDLANAKYALSPKAKAALRSMIKGTNGTGMVFEAGEVDGTPAQVSGNVGKDAKVIFGDWSQFVIAQFGNVDITIDPYTLADTGQIRLVVNVYVDFMPVREECFVTAEIGEAEDDNTEVLDPSTNH